MLCVTIRVRTEFLLSEGKLISQTEIGTISSIRMEISRWWELCFLFRLEIPCVQEQCLFHQNGNF